MGAQIAAHLVNANVPTLLFGFGRATGRAKRHVNKGCKGCRNLTLARFQSAKLNFIRLRITNQHLDHCVIAI